MATEHSFAPKIVGIICNWCCYGGADLCGVSRFQYPPHIRLIRVMCSARVDPLHILRALANRQDGIFIGGCHLCDCHYVTNGNFNAFSMVQVCRRILRHIGVYPERLRIEWVSAGEGIRFANFMHEFSAELVRLGPIGKAEGIAEADLERKLRAVQNLVPHLKLVLTQKLGVAVRTEEAYRSFFASQEFEGLFEELLVGKLATAEMLLLLRDRPLSTSELSERLHLSPSDVSAHLGQAAKHGLVRYDVTHKRYAMA